MIEDRIWIIVTLTGFVGLMVASTMLEGNIFTTPVGMGFAIPFYTGFVKLFSDIDKKRRTHGR